MFDLVCYRWWLQLLDTQLIAFVRHLSGKGHLSGDLQLHPLSRVL